jgi:hypothetical protein
MPHPQLYRIPATPKQERGRRSSWLVSRAEPAQEFMDIFTILGVKWFGYPDLNADGSIRNMNQVCRIEEYLKPFVRFEALRPQILRKKK